MMNLMELNCSRLVIAAAEHQRTRRGCLSRSVPALKSSLTIKKFRANPSFRVENRQSQACCAFVSFLPIISLVDENKRRKTSRLSIERMQNRLIECADGKVSLVAVDTSEGGQSRRSSKSCSLPREKRLIHDLSTLARANFSCTRARKQTSQL